MENEDKTTYINVKEYLEHLKDKGHLLKEYKKVEELYPIEVYKDKYKKVVCRNQAGKKVEIGASFLNIYYDKTKKGTYVLKEPPVYLAVSIIDEITFFSTEGQKFHLFPKDYIIIDVDKKISGVSKQEFKENFVYVHQLGEIEDEEELM